MGWAVPEAGLVSRFVGTRHFLPLSRVLWLLAACANEDGLRRVPPDGFFSPSMLSVSETRVGDVQRQPVTLTNAAGDPLEIVTLGFRPRLDVFEVRAADARSLPGRRLAPNAQIELKILFGPDREATYETTLQLTTMDLEIGMPVSGIGSLLSPPALDGPARVAFTDSIVAGQTLTQRVEIRNAGEQATRLVRARSDPPFSVTLRGGAPIADAGPVAPEDRVELDVHFAPRVEGVFEGTVSLEAERSMPLVMEVSGSAGPAGTMTCVPNPVELGRVVRGHSQFQPVECTTTGGPAPVTRVAWVPPPREPLILRNVSPPPPAQVTGKLGFEVGLTARGLPTRHTGTVEVQLGTGEVHPITVRGETVAPRPEDVALSVTAAWSADSDIDLHLVESGAEPYASGRDCYWGSKTLDWNQPSDPSDDPFLDRDARRGPGEETINLEVSRGAVYEVWVQYFGPAASRPTEVFAYLRLEGRPAVRRIRTLTECGITWYVGRLRFDVRPAIFEAVDTETKAFASFTFECGN